MHWCSLVAACQGAGSSVETLRELIDVRPTHWRRRKGGAGQGSAGLNERPANGAGRSRGRLGKVRQQAQFGFGIADWLADAPPKSSIELARYAKLNSELVASTSIRLVRAISATAMTDANSTIE